MGGMGGSSRYRWPMVGRKVGVFGGTFDPPHIGHLVTAIDAREQLGLDLVLLVVANEPWQKVGSRAITPAADRLAMVRAAVQDVEGLEASDVEIRRGGPSYTVETLEALRSANPGDELFLLLGSDAAAGLDSWERALDLRSLCRIVVVGRPGFPLRVPEDFAVEHLDGPRLDVSATELRARVAAGRSVRFLVPDAVATLVLERGLYGERR